MHRGRKRRDVRDLDGERVLGAMMMMRGVPRHGRLHQARLGTLEKRRQRWIRKLMGALDWAVFGSCPE